MTFVAEWLSLTDDLFTEGQLDGNNRLLTYTFTLRPSGSFAGKTDTLGGDCPGRAHCGASGGFLGSVGDRGFCRRRWRQAGKHLNKLIV
jgi:hypothetical protein